VDLDFLADSGPTHGPTSFHQKILAKNTLDMPKYGQNIIGKALWVDNGKIAMH
jgi:hypothetical protein